MRTQLRISLWVIAAAVFVLVLFVLFAWAVDRPFEYLSREPVEVLQADNRYVGWFAHLTAVVWWAGAISALFAAAVLRTADRWGEGGRFLAAGGLFGSVLVADDLFLLHEALNQRTGVHELYVFSLYAVAACVFVWRFRRALMSREALLLLLAAVFFGISIVVDFGERVLGQQMALAEDGPKWIGVCLYTAFFVRDGLDALVTAIRSRVPQTVSAKQRGVPN